SDTAGPLPPELRADETQCPLQQEAAERALTRKDPRMAGHSRAQRRFASLQPAVHGQGTLHVAPSRRRRNAVYTRLADVDREGTGLQFHRLTRLDTRHVLLG